MASLLIAGECMLELNQAPEQGQSDLATFHRAFAGDTYNSAVYAKRWLFDDIKVSFMSAVGTDPISRQMTAAWSQEAIDQSLVFNTPDAHPGVYAILTDEQGERSFIYWRKDSAATQFMHLLDTHGGAEAIPDFDCFYYSGITLAILSDDDKTAFMRLVSTLRQRGTRIAFDPNYRAQLWRNPAHAEQWISAAYRSCDLALPGLDDHQSLFNHRSAQQIHDWLDNLGVTEMVVKGGSAGMYCFNTDGTNLHHPFTPAPTQLDATAAGDSFAGTYLAARLSGASMDNAVTAAANIAACVVQHRGAIIDRGVYDQCRNEMI